MARGDEPAYPADRTWDHCGMTIRERFAMAAMQGILAATGANLAGMNVPMLAVHHADALLYELEESDEEN